MRRWDDMTSRIATYQFVVPDRRAAEGLVLALSEHGFPQVGARPRVSPQKEIPGMSWQVDVVDEGPYSYGIVGSRQLAGAELGARAIARRFGGFRIGRSWASSARMPSLQRSNPPILIVNPGSHVLRVEFQTSTTPPVGPLSLGPDRQVEQSPPLDFLATVNWAELDHAYGSARDLPDLIAQLVVIRDEDEWDAISFEITNRVLHQGSCYSATAPTLHALLNLLVENTFRATRRYAIYLDVLFAAGRRDETLIANRERAAAYGQQPRPISWSPEVFDEVGSLVPDLLNRWDIEPPANRLILSALAATYRHAGAAIEGKIAEGARENYGTQVGDLFCLADQLICGDPEALGTAMRIATWNDKIRFSTLDDETIEPQVRVLRTLCDSVAECAGAA